MTRARSKDIRYFAVVDRRRTSGHALDVYPSEVERCVSEMRAAGEDFFGPDYCLEVAHARVFAELTRSPSQRQELRKNRGHHHEHG
jgi:hypothetical protein